MTQQIPPPPARDDQEVTRLLAQIEDNTRAARRYLGWLVFVFVVLPIIVIVLAAIANSGDSSTTFTLP